MQLAVMHRGRPTLTAFGWSWMSKHVSSLPCKRGEKNLQLSLRYTHSLADSLLFVPCGFFIVLVSRAFSLLSCFFFFLLPNRRSQNQNGNTPPPLRNPPRKERVKVRRKKKKKSLLVIYTISAKALFSKPKRANHWTRARGMHVFRLI